MKYLVEVADANHVSLQEVNARGIPEARREARIAHIAMYKYQARPGLGMTELPTEIYTDIVESFE